MLDKEYARLKKSVAELMRDRKHREMLRDLIGPEFLGLSGHTGR